MKRDRARASIPLYDLKLSGAAKRAVNITLGSGWLSPGPNVDAFERAVGTYDSVEYAAATGSASVGLHLALRAVGVGRGCEVITTPFTFVSTVEAILHCGGRPIFADIDPANLNIDTEQVERLISEKTAAVLPVDIAGRPADYHELISLCDGRSIPLIADAAHSFGATYRSRTVAQVADAAVHSFYATKNLTCGEGGMVVSRHKPIIDVVRLLARHGMTSNAYQRRKNGLQTYDITAVGYKANMSEVNAAIGLGEMESFERNQFCRSRIAERYRQKLAGLGDYLELPQVDNTRSHAWHLYIVRLNPSRLKIDRDRFIAKMALLGVECGVHYRPVFEMSFYRDALGISGRELPHARSAGSRVVSLPIYPRLKLTAVDYVCECIEATLGKHMH